jgi:hypothetical protein
MEKERRRESMMYLNYDVFPRYLNPRALIRSCNGKQETNDYLLL